MKVVAEILLWLSLATLIVISVLPERENDMPKYSEIDMLTAPPEVENERFQDRGAAVALITSLFPPNTPEPVEPEELTPPEAEMTEQLLPQQEIEEVPVVEELLEDNPIIEEQELEPEAIEPEPQRVPWLRVVGTIKREMGYVFYIKDENISRIIEFTDVEDTPNMVLDIGDDEIIVRYNDMKYLIRK